MTSQAFTRAPPLNLNKAQSELDPLITPNTVSYIDYNEGSGTGTVFCTGTITGPQSTAITNYFASYSYLAHPSFNLTLDETSYGNNVILSVNQTASRTLTLPDTTDTVVARNTTDTLTNKTLTSSTNDITASRLFSNSGANTITLVAASNPVTGQALVATSSTTAAWGEATYPSSLTVQNTPAALDAFGRLRVSNPTALLSSKQLTSDFNNIAWSVVTGGGGGSSYSQDLAQTTLTVTTAQFAYAVRQSKSYTNYQPGKSQQIFVTFVFGEATTGSTTGIRKRVGYFNTNNGIFLQTLSGAVSMCRRTFTSGAPVNNYVAQASWNIDTFDGSGPSGVTLDFTNTQILLIDFEWLGVGVVRTGFVVNGAIYYAHYFNNANVLTSVYMSSPNLPVRYEIMNVNATNPGPNSGTLGAICASVSSEGGSQFVGITRGISVGSSSLLNPSNGVTYPLLVFRLKSGYAFSTVKLNTFSVACNNSTTYLTSLLLNPTFTGTVPAYTGVTNSSIEYFINSTTALTINTVGTVLYNTYTIQTTNSFQNNNITQSEILLGSTADVTVTNASDVSTGTVIAQTFDICALCIQVVADSNNSRYFASFVYNEVY